MSNTPLTIVDNQIWAIGFRDFCCVIRQFGPNSVTTRDINFTFITATYLSKEQYSLFVLNAIKPQSISHA